MKEWLSNLVIADIFYPVLSYVLLTVSSVIVDTIRGLRKEQTISRAKDIVLECTEAAFAQTVPDIIIALKDGKITTEEWEQIKSKTILLATPRLTNLSNFAKDEIRDWVNLQFEVIKIKFLRGVMGKELASPTDEAV